VAGIWHITAKAFEARNALARLWISDKNITGLARCAGALLQPEFSMG
jgi:hypothetical protein